MLRGAKLFFSFALIGAITPFSEQAVGATRIAALSYQQAPGLSTGSVFAEPFAWDFNNAGQVALYAWTSSLSPHEQNRVGIWAERNGRLDFVASDGMQSPDSPAETLFNDFRGVDIDDLGRVTFVAEASGPGIDPRRDRTGVWRQRGDELVRLTVPEQPLPGLADVSLSGPSQVRVSSTGRLSFLAYAREFDSGNWRGEWLVREDANGVFSPVVQLGEVQAPGLSEEDLLIGVNWDLNFRNGPIVVNDHGETAFRGTILSLADGSLSEMVFAKRRGQITPLVREGDPVPGIDSQATFARFYDPKISDAGELMLIADLQGDTLAPDENSRGLWSTVGSDQLRLIARTGDPVPDVSEGLRIESIGGVRFGEPGQIYFSARLREDGATSSGWINGVWSVKEGAAPQLVFLTGDPAPGLLEENMIEYAGIPVHNRLGQYMVSHIIAGPELDPLRPHSAIWATSPEGALTLIAREGDIIDVDDDPLIEDLRTISFIRESKFTDRGEVAFLATFTDQTWAIVVDRSVAIPEPMAACLLMTMAATLSCRPSRHSRCA